MCLLTLTCDSFQLLDRQMRWVCIDVLHISPICRHKYRYNRLVQAVNHSIRLPHELSPHRQRLDMGQQLHRVLIQGVHLPQS